MALFFQGFVTGGRDGVVVMWDRFFEQCIKVFKVEGASMNPGSVMLQDLPAIRSIHTDEDKILVGTGNDEVRQRYTLHSTLLASS